MGKVIQMIPTSENNSLFICGLSENGELLFRTARNPAHLQQEKMTIDNGMVYTNLYNFSIKYLKKFIKANEEV